MERLRGAWLLAPLGERCLLVEQFSWSEAGGVVGAVEALALESSMRDALSGMERLAREIGGSEESAGGAVTVKPDGTALGGATEPDPAPQSPPSGEPPSR